MRKETNVLIGTRDFANDPLPLINELRHQGDVVWSAEKNAWLVLSFDLVNEGLSSSEHLRAGEYIHEFAQVIPFLNGDPDGSARRVVKAAFTKERVEDLLATIRTEADAIIDGWQPNEAIDFPSQFSNPFVSRIICKLLHLPESFTPDMVNTVDGILTFFGKLPPTESDLEQVGQIFQAVMRRLITQFEKESPTGVFHLDKWDSEKAALIAVPLLFVGISTARSAINSAVFRLVEQQLNGRLRAEPKLIPQFVEEAIRFDPPNQFVSHIAVEDILLGGQRISAGDRMMFMIGAANHDVAEFEHPDVFDIDRSENRHLGFGAGDHYCLGNQLARLEMRETIACLTRRFKSAELVSQPEWVQRQNFRTITSMQTRWTI